MKATARGGKRGPGEAFLIYLLTLTHTHMSAMQERKNRIDRLLKMLKSAEPPIDEAKLRAVASFNLGVSPQKINEYLNILYQLEVFRYEPEGLVLKEV